MEEPDARGGGADGDQGLHPPRGPGPGGVREGRAGRRRAPWRPVAVVQAISPSEAQAAIATSTAAQAGEPQPDGVLGQPRLVGPADDVNDAHGPTPPTRSGDGPGEAAARAAPVGHGPEDGARPSLSSRGGPGAPPSSRRDHGAEGALRHPFGRLGVQGQLHGDRHGFGRRLLQLPHHHPAGVRRRAPVDEAAGVARHVRAGAPGQTLLGRAVARARRPSPRRGAGARAAPDRNGATRGAPTGGGACTRFVHHCSANGAAEAMSSVDRLVDATAGGHQRDGLVDRAPPAARPDERRRGPAARPGGPGRGGATSTQTGTGSRRCRHPARCAWRPGPASPTTQGPDDPDEEGAEDEVAQHLDPAGARVVGDQPPQADDRARRRRSAPGAGRVAPSGSRSGRWGSFREGARSPRPTGRRRRRPRR